MQYINCNSKGYNTVVISYQTFDLVGELICFFLVMTQFNDQKLKFITVQFFMFHQLTFRVQLHNYRNL